MLLEETKCRKAPYIALNSLRSKLKFYANQLIDHGATLQLGISWAYEMKLEVLSNALIIALIIRISPLHGAFTTAYKMEDHYQFAAATIWGVDPVKD